MQGSCATTRHTAPSSRLQLTVHRTYLPCPPPPPIHTRRYHWLPQAYSLYDEWSTCPLLANESTPVLHYTPHYLYDPVVPRRVKYFYPHADDMRFIVMLREPVERAVSSYWFKHSARFSASGVDQGSAEHFRNASYIELGSRMRFDACVRERRIQWCVPGGSDGASSDVCRNSSDGELSPVHGSGGASDAERAFALKAKALEEDATRCEHHLWPTTPGLRHLDKGMYAEQLERWLAVFPLENFLFVCQENFASESRYELRRVLRWLGVLGTDVGISAHSSVGEDPLGYTDGSHLEELLRQRWPVGPTNSRTPVSVAADDGERGEGVGCGSGGGGASAAATTGPELLKLMQEHYAPHNKRLWELTGIRCPGVQWNY
jgi:hypothetical protein